MVYVIQNGFSFSDLDCIKGRGKLNSPWTVEQTTFFIVVWSRVGRQTTPTSVAPPSGTSFALLGYRTFSIHTSKVTLR